METIWLQTLFKPQNQTSTDVNKKSANATINKCGNANSERETNEFKQWANVKQCVDAFVHCRALWFGAVNFHFHLLLVSWSSLVFEPESYEDTTSDLQFTLRDGLTFRVHFWRLIHFQSSVFVHFCFVLFSYIRFWRPFIFNYSA